MDLKIAWFPYEYLQIKQTKQNHWVIVESDSTRKGAIPVIMITYPESGDSIWVEMNTKNELLGKLIKHSLMSQEPIFEPYGDYLAKLSVVNAIHLIFQSILVGKSIKHPELIQLLSYLNLYLV